MRSTYKTWTDGSAEPAGDSLEHIYDQHGNFQQNYDGTATYGAVWHWAGADPQTETSHPLKSPNADTAAQTGYNLADNRTPQARTFLNPTTEGDERHLWGQGRPQAKDASGSGSAWANATQSGPLNMNTLPVVSKLDYTGTVTATDMNRATDAREKGRVGIFGSQLSYVGGSGRVTSETIGRDINPMGRGNGYAYLSGLFTAQNAKLAPARPLLPVPGGTGNSVNNLYDSDPHKFGACDDHGVGLVECCCCPSYCNSLGAAGCVGGGGQCPQSCDEEAICARWEQTNPGEECCWKRDDLSPKQKCCCCPCYCWYPPFTGGEPPPPPKYCACCTDVNCPCVLGESCPTCGQDLNQQGLGTIKVSVIDLSSGSIPTVMFSVPDLMVRAQRTLRYLQGHHGKYEPLQAPMPSSFCPCDPDNIEPSGTGNVPCMKLKPPAGVISKCKFTMPTPSQLCYDCWKWKNGMKNVADICELELVACETACKEPVLCPACCYSHYKTCYTYRNKGKCQQRKGQHRDDWPNWERDDTTCAPKMVEPPTK